MTEKRPLFSFFFVSVFYHFPLCFCFLGFAGKGKFVYKKKSLSKHDCIFNATFQSEMRLILYFRNYTWADVTGVTLTGMDLWGVVDLPGIVGVRGRRSTGRVEFMKNLKFA